AYYEIWGSLESANRALWAALWLAATVAILSLIVVRVLAGRPPVVIRVDGAGQAQVAAAGSQTAVSEAEIKNFLTLFEKFFTELNAYTYDADLKLAFSMMTPEFRIKANDILKRGGAVEDIKASMGKTVLTLTEIIIVKETPQVLECLVKGYRQVGSYKPDADPKEAVFERSVILKKVQRSGDAPYGVLVQDWAESLFKRA
ncbi:MAG: hypothetical protein PHF00_07195, partial [Elusimicrobia bacterium]|nr:hypothetical protein [Elusimicrobiota bacterium]